MYDVVIRLSLATSRYLSTIEVLFIEIQNQYMFLAQVYINGDVHLI